MNKAQLFRMCRGTAAPAAPAGTEDVFDYNGVVMTLDTALESGTFAMGDQWAVVTGSPNLTSTTPPAVLASGSLTPSGSYTNRAVHGLMVDPGRGITGGQTSGTPTGWQQAFDSLDTSQAPDGSTILDYLSALQKDPGLTGVPLALSANTSLVKGKSTLTPNREGRENLTNMAILTLLSTAPPANSFRPHPTDTDKTPLFTTDDIDLSFLPNHAVPSGHSIPDATTTAAAFAKPWQTFFTNNLFVRSISPYPNNMLNNYGVDIANQLGLTLLYLCTNGWTAGEKLTVSKGLIQIGIDIWRRAVNGGEFPSLLASFGGGQHWYKPLVVFAAKALEGAANSAAAALLADYADAAQKKMFAEDICIFRMSRERIETPRETPDPTYDGTEYAPYAENTIEWYSNPSNYAGGGMGWNVKYRLTQNPTSMGYVLALRLMSLDTLWNSARYFEYWDRWKNWVALEGLSQLNASSEYTLFVRDMISNYWPAYPSAAPTLVRTVAEDSYVWFEFDKVLDLTSVPATSAFAATVAGVSRSVTAVTVYGRSLVATLASAVTAGQSVTLAYTQPGGTKARTLALTAVASISATTATNQTDALPTPAASRELLYNSASATRQQLGTVRVPANSSQGLLTAVDRFLVVLRLRFNSRVANDVMLGNSTGSTSSMKFYLATATAPRCFIGSQALRAPGMLSAADDGATITMSFAMDFTATGVTNKYRAAAGRAAGQTSYDTSSSTDPAAGITFDMVNILSGGIGLMGTMSTLTNALDASLEFAYFDYGRSADGFTLPASLTAGAFAYNFDPGGNGENITGTAPWFFWAGTRAQANSVDGLPNRGRAGALNMYAQRDADVYPFTAPP